VAVPTVTFPAARHDRPWTIPKLLGNRGTRMWTTCQSRYVALPWPAIEPVTSWRPPGRKSDALPWATMPHIVALGWTDILSRTFAVLCVLTEMLTVCGWQVSEVSKVREGRLELVDRKEQPAESDRLVHWDSPALPVCSRRYVYMSLSLCYVCFTVCFLFMVALSNYSIASDHRLRTFCLPS